MILLPFCKGRQLFDVKSPWKSREMVPYPLSLLYKHQRLSDQNVCTGLARQEYRLELKP